MYISPPIAVPILLAIGIGATAMLAPPQREPAQVSVTLSATTYSKLALWAKDHAGEDGEILTVEQVIEEFVNNQKKNMRP